MLKPKPDTGQTVISYDNFAEAIAPPSGIESTFHGTSGNDTKTGTSAGDTFYMQQGGADKVFGEGGEDQIHFGNTFNANDFVNGGAGSDTLYLSGASYSGGLTITSSMLKSVDYISLADNHSYHFVITDSVIASGSWNSGVNMWIDAGALSSGHSLYVDASSEASAHVIAMSGGAGNDTLIGGAGRDQLYGSASIGGGGHDTINAHAGDDFIGMWGFLDSGDRINGGNGTDTLNLFGDYSSGLTLNGTMLKSIESISLNFTYDYNLTTADSLVAAGKTLRVDASGIQGGHHFSFDGLSETDGHFNFYDGPGNNGIDGGQRGDTFNLFSGAQDSVDGAGGNDTINILGNYGATYSLDGGAGFDTLSLAGDYSSGLVMTSSMLANVEDIKLHAGDSYNLTENNGNVAAGKSLTVDGRALTSSDHLTFDGANETNGGFLLYGGSGSDVLKGGALGDSFDGGLGADTFNGRGGNDAFLYESPNASTGSGFDQIFGFDATGDGFVLPTAVSGVDPEIDGGTLSLANFDSDLAAAVDSSHLAQQHAVLFKPDAGNQAGRTFLVIDANDTAGYQAGADYVIWLHQGVNLAMLSAANFFGP